MAVVTQVSAESVVEGIMKPKRVRKAILKVHNSDNSSKTLENALLFAKTLENQQTIATMASTIDVIIPTKVKTAKPRSKRGSTIEIAAENTPSTFNMEPILKATIPINGINESNVLENSTTHAILDATMGIQVDNPDNPLIKVSKRTVGRPLGSLDKVKRHALGDNRLGRPPGSKDTAPRKRRMGRPSLLAEGF